MSDIEAELWRDGVACVRAAITGDVDAMRFLLANAANLADLAELILGFSVEAWITGLAAGYPGATRDELAALADDILTDALRQGPAWERT